MRRFLVWTILLALIGLALAIGGYWAYNHFWARFQPVAVNRNQAEIQQLLDSAPWVSEGGGAAPLYVVTYRDNAATQRYRREEAERLRAAGVDVRIIVFARGDREGLSQSNPAERSTVAELWLSRDWALYDRWTSTPPGAWTAAGVAPADGDQARSAVVEGSRDFVRRLTALLSDNGVQSGYPLILWRDREGYLKACACSDARSWAFIRDDLGVPDRPGGPAPLPAPGQGAPGDGTMPGTYPQDGYVAPPPGGYPTIPPATPGQYPPGQTPPGQQPGAQPPRPRPQLPAQPNPPGVNEKGEPQEDTTFFY